jgi:60S ribosomal subunit assembly/export protein LOC1
MAPTRGSSKGASSGGASKGPKGSKPSNLSSSSRVSKPSGKKNVKRPPPVEVKAKARSAPENLKRKKKRVYTEAELDLPKLNQITPVGVVKPKGKKKGKVFVDDQVCPTSSWPCLRERTVLLTTLFRRNRRV